MMKKLVFLFLTLIVLFSSCSTKNIETKKYDILDVFRNSYTELTSKKEESDRISLQRFYETLSDEEKVAQLFLVSLDGNSTERVNRILKANKTAPGGYLLFAFNIPDTAEETIEFLGTLENAFLESGIIPPYISIDHEGGVVNRLRRICSKLPSQLSVAQKFTEQEALRLYELQGIQLRNLGIQVNLAPVVEVLTEENILFLDDRSYGGLDDVITYSNAQISGMRKAGVLPVLKHFPGNTNNDPHTGLPVLECDVDTLNNLFIKPFDLLNDKKMMGVLVAHTEVPSIDDKPSCLSEKIIGMLNNGGKTFQGLVFSDDLLMKALIRNGHPVEQSLIDAINAGINVLMISTGSFDEYAAIVLNEYKKNDLFKKKVDESVMKILEWKISCNLLQRKTTQTGFFEYETEVFLPESISPEELAKRGDAFSDAYEEAAALYDEIWWSR